MGETQERRWAAWMVRAQNGDGGAYRQLLTEVSSALRAFVRPRCAAAVPMEDVVQEVLLAIHKARHTYDPEQSFTAWLYAIARYKLTDVYRHCARREAHEITMESPEMEEGIAPDAADGSVAMEVDTLLAA